MSESWENPVTVVPHENLVPVSDHLSKMFDIPPSRMFLINKSLSVYKNRRPDSPMFDASQGDGGASLPGVPEELLVEALELQRRHGSAYDMPYGTDEFRRYVEGKTGFREPDIGSRTDIRVLCRDIPGGNLSIGYRNEHTEFELLKFEDWKYTLDICKKWFAEDCLPVFKRG
jgi:hypothetical protein